MAKNIIPFNNGGVWNEWLAAQEAQLPELEDMAAVSSRVVRILGGNPGQMQLQGTNTYLIGTGKSRILIDTGEGIPAWTERITSLLRSEGLNLAYILLTHWHGDHTGGVPDLIAYDPALASRVYKHTPDAGQRAISDGQIFQVEGATVRAVHTPGHAVGHMCFVLEEENALFTGDNVLGHGFSVKEDLAAYVRSLQRMRELKCEVGYPAHGERVENLPARMDLYIRHKEARERQIADALPPRRAGGGVTIKALVRELHGDLPPHVVSQAIEPLASQVLWKLAGEKRAAFSCLNRNPGKAPKHSDPVIE
ncbi:metallo-beta-lactamase superfamily protein [Canariomyces notabilis]|uniref:Metallo-beta-lactamase superfamily protein n=1 Tax=Canariomyces notabilis TaxID=2074819 RepID=A0AAN6YQ93_9PEZI|nr:metallo-beta-lactamase superfamily protein [Canariomyces arenarius]